MLYPEKISMLLVGLGLLGACSPMVGTTAPQVNSKQFVFPVYETVVLPHAAVFSKAEDEAFCLATVIYKEARNQSEKPMLGVAFVTIHRAARHHNDVSSICEAVFSYKQFAWTVKPQISHRRLSSHENIREEQKRLIAMYEQMAWERSQAVAERALNQPLLNPVRDALYFHDRSMRPKWAKHLQPVAHLGAFIFYRDPNYHDPRG